MKTSKIWLWILLTVIVILVGIRSVSSLKLKPNLDKKMEEAQNARASGNETLKLQLKPIWNQKVKDIHEIQIADTGDLVVIQTMDGNITSFSQEGKMAWQVNAKPNFLMGTDHEFNPVPTKQYVITKDEVIYGDGEDKLLAINFKGEKLWEKSGLGIVREVQLSVDKLCIGVYSFLNGKPLLTVFALDGTELWKAEVVKDGLHINVGPQGQWVTLGTFRGFYLIEQNGQSKKLLTLDMVEGDIFAAVSLHGDIAVMPVPYDHVVILSSLGNVLGNINIPQAHWGKWNIIKFTADGKRILSVGGLIDGPALVASDLNGHIIWRLTGNSFNESIVNVAEVGDRYYVVTNRNSRSKTSPGELTILDKQGEVLQKITFPQDVQAASTVGDGHHIVTVTRGGEVTYWQI